MPDFEWNPGGRGTTAETDGDVLHIAHDGPDDDIWQVRLLHYEMDALAVAWLRWRADHAPADIERLLAAAERTQEGGE